MVIDSFAPALPLLEIAPSDIGLGVFARAPIDAGQTICVLRGPLLNLRQVRAKGAAAGNVLQVGTNCYLDLEPPGRYLNHACVPNAGLRDDTRLVALNQISANTEIRFDYSTTIGDGWTMPCACGAAGCRGNIAAFQCLPANLRQRYLTLDIVQRFLWQELGA